MILKYAKLADTAHDPVRFYNSDACWDLHAHGYYTVKSYSHTTITTDIRIDIPYGYCGMIMSRSGLAANKGLFVLNAPGIIDAGYDGAIKIIIANMTDTPAAINDGDRIAQLFISPVEQHYLLRDDTLQIFSDRGSGGLGSTGY